MTSIDGHGVWPAVLALLVATACVPANPVEDKRSDYEQWQADVTAELRGIDGYLDDNDAGDAAIVLDIDNTALESEYHPGEPNRPVWEAARHAQQRGMAVLIVSARLESDEDQTLNQLERADYSPDGICLREFGVSMANAKQKCRKDYAADGYTITANIGNRASDFEGGDYDRAYRLPDYGGRLS